MLTWSFEECSLGALSNALLELCRMLSWSSFIVDGIFVTFYPYELLILAFIKAQVLSTSDFVCHFLPLNLVCNHFYSIMKINEETSLFVFVYRLYSFP